MTTTEKKESRFPRSASVTHAEHIHVVEKFGTFSGGVAALIRESMEKEKKRRRR